MLIARPNSFFYVPLDYATPDIPEMFPLCLPKCLQDYELLFPFARYFMQKCRVIV